MVLICINLIYEGCETSETIANKLYKNKEHLLNEFEGKSVFRRGKKFIFLYCHKGNKVNSFFFEKKDITYSFSRDSIQFDIAEINGLDLNNKNDTGVYHKSLCKKIGGLLGEMDSLNIREVSSEYKSIGVDLKVYFNDRGALLYVPDPNAITNSEWKSYVSAAKKYDRNWYFTMDE